MGFLCELTGKHVEGAPRKIVIERRERKYFNRLLRDGKPVERHSEGWEVAREINVDPSLDQQRVERLVKEKFNVTPEPRKVAPKPSRSSGSPFRPRMEPIKPNKANSDYR